MGAPRAPRITPAPRVPPLRARRPPAVVSVKPAVLRTTTSLLARTLRRLRARRALTVPSLMRLPLAARPRRATTTPAPTAPPVAAQVLPPVGAPQTTSRPLVPTPLPPPARHAQVELPRPPPPSAPPALPATFAPRPASSSTVAPRPRSAAPQTTTSLLATPRTTRTACRALLALCSPPPIGRPRQRPAAPPTLAPVRPTARASLAAPPTIISLPVPVRARRTTPARAPPARAQLAVRLTTTSPLPEPILLPRNVPPAVRALSSPPLRSALQPLPAIPTAAKAAPAVLATMVARLTSTKHLATRRVRRALQAKSWQLRPGRLLPPPASTQSGPAPVPATAAPRLAALPTTSRRPALPRRLEALPTAYAARVRPTPLQPPPRSASPPPPPTSARAPATYSSRDRPVRPSVALPTTGIPALANALHAPPAKKPRPALSAT